MSGAIATKRQMRVSPKVRPLNTAELAELRDLKRDLRLLLEQSKALGPYVSAAKAARMLDLKPRTICDLVRDGHFPGAWKPAGNRLHLPVREVMAYIEARRVSSPTTEGASGE